MLAQASSTCSLASAPQAARTRGREGHAATRGTRCARGQDLPSSLAPLRKAAEPRRVMLEDMGNDVQVVGRERGLDVAAGRDVGHPEVDLALPGVPERQHRADPALLAAHEGQCLRKHTLLLSPLADGAQGCLAPAGRERNDPALKPGQRLARWARRSGGFAVRWMVGSATWITGRGSSLQLWIVSYLGSVADAAPRSWCARVAGSDLRADARDMLGLLLALCAACVPPPIARGHAHACPARGTSRDARRSALGAARSVVRDRRAPTRPSRASIASGTTSGGCRSGGAISACSAVARVRTRARRAYCVRRTIWSRTAWKAVSSCATSPA